MDFLYALRAFDGFWYYFTAVLCIIFMMAIIGFLMERYQIQKEKDALSSLDDKKEVVNTFSNVDSVPTTENEVVSPVNTEVIDFSQLKPVEEEEVPKENDFKEIEEMAPVIPDIILENNPVLEESPKVSEPFVLDLTSGEVIQDITEEKKEM